MNDARHLVAFLLDEAYTPDYSEPSGRNYAAERAAINKDLATGRQQEVDREALQKKKEEERERREAERKQKELERDERDLGLDTEREMRERGIPLDQPAISFSGRSLAKAKDYFENPHRPKFSKMKEVKVGQVTQPTLPPAKPVTPSFQIKGRQKWEPKNRTMPKPWTNWK